MGDVLAALKASSIDSGYPLEPQAHRASGEMVKSGKGAAHSG